VIPTSSLAREAIATLLAHACEGLAERGVLVLDRWLRLEVIPLGADTEVFLLCPRQAAQAFAFLEMYVARRKLGHVAVDHLRVIGESVKR